MRLFVFEGEKRESRIFNSLLALYFQGGSESDVLYFTYNNSIHKLYKELSQNEMSLFRVLQETERSRKEQVLAGFVEDDVTEIFLFFDYDFQNRHVALEDWNQEIGDMLAYFSDETRNGKLYISYPMLEAIRYTKLLPDAAYYQYTVSRKDCQEKEFKKLAAHFSEEYYPDLDFIVAGGRTPDEEVKQNWEWLKRQNVAKANYICNGENVFPVSKVEFGQARIFECQLAGFVNTEGCSVSILSAFALFLYDYFKA